MTRTITANQNGLLGALPQAEAKRFAPHLSSVDLAIGDVIYEAGARQRYVYFPTDSIVSLLCVTGSRLSSQVGSVGNEGLVGIAPMMGGEATPRRAVVQSAGHAFRLDAKFIRDEFMRAGATHDLFLRYTQALFVQVAQTAACNRQHNTEQQLCRLLLTNLDRSSTNELSMTHGVIARILGVRRETVTSAASRLQDAGAIHYSRGRIRIPSRQSLERAACECYSVVKEEFARLLPRNGVRTQRRRLTPAP